MDRRRAAVAGCVLVITAVLLGAACAARGGEGVEVVSGGVLFRVRQPSASSMAVAGDFNGWSQTTHPMVRSGAVWTCVIALPPGEHLFMYVVDGTSWMTPAHATEVVPDGFGGWNGRVVVP